MEAEPQALSVSLHRHNRKVKDQTHGAPMHDTGYVANLLGKCFIYSVSQGGVRSRAVQ